MAAEAPALAPSTTPSAASAPTVDATTEHPVVLFDGVCNLCNGAVQFIIDRDPSGHFRFAALQSEPGKALLRARNYPVPEGDPDTVLLVQGDAVYSHSTAALRIARKLHRLYPVLGLLGLLWPRFIRDAVYRFIARNRYRWFGKEESCRVPTPELRARFLK